MASRGGRGGGPKVVTSTTSVPTQREVTLRIREAVEDMQNDMTTRLEKDLRNAQRDLEGRDEEGMLAFVDDNFDVLNSKFKEHSDGLREYVKKKMPKKPDPKDYPNKEDLDRANEQYKEEVDNFKAFTIYVTNIISRLTDFIVDLFSIIKEFFKSLWNWIKSKLEAIATKVKEFIDFIRDKFSGLVNYVFS